MKKFVFTMAIAAIAAPGIVLAGAGGNSCADAQILYRNADYTGDTTGNTSFVGGFGGLPSPGPDAAYKFTSDGQPTGSIAVTINGGWNAAIIMTEGCAGNAGNAINAATGPGAILTMPMEDAGTHAPLTAGTTYYVFITGNPSDNSGPHGAYGFHTPGPLPVSLQDFSID